MLAKLTSKNQLTLPKLVVQQVGASQYFDVAVRDGQIVLTPVRIQRGDAVRAKLAALGIGPGDVDEAVRWSRTSRGAQAVAEPKTPYAVGGSRKPRPVAGRKPRTRRA